jgi:hypothetical protein
MLSFYPCYRPIFKAALQPNSLASGRFTHCILKRSESVLAPKEDLDRLRVSNLTNA